MEPGEAEAREIVVFHDESGDFGHGEWVFTGMLWVPREGVEPLAAELRARREEYTGEIHFYRFPRNFGGRYGAAARTGQAWLERWRAEWAARTWLSVLAVNRRHVRYDHARFARPRLAYNHFTALALRLGLAAFFKGQPAIRLAVCSDERSGRAEGANGAPAGDDDDGVAAALRQAAREAHAAGDAALAGDPAAVPVWALSCAEHDDGFSAEQELLQLTDLLLGAISTAILPRTVAATKLWLAREMARTLASARQPAPTGAASLRGRLLVNYYPDPVGRVYQDGQMGIWEL